jgi:hypothetical protein
MILVTIDSKRGEFQRYMRGQDGRMTKTHHGVYDGGVEFTPELIAMIRVNPPDACRIGWPVEASGVFA